MPIDVTFYQLDDADIMAAVTPLIVDFYRARKPVALICDTKSQAEHWDEHLWQQPNDAFIAHNLRGEGPSSGAPVTLLWPPVSEAKTVMINLSSEQLNLPRTTQHIIEFVPTDDAAKQAAREKYKAYQAAGCTMQFKQISKESNNG